MKTFTRIVVVVAAALALAACPFKKDKVKPPVQPPVPPSPPVLTTLYVNAATGSDANSGAQNTPLKTITKATELATSGSTINVAPGTYNAANGEIFPISVPGGVALLGDEANKGAGSNPTSVVGGGLAPGAASGTVAVALIPGQGSTVAGLTVTNDNGAFAERRGLMLSNGTVTLRNNTVTGATQTVGVYVGASSNHVITSNRIANNQGSGLGFIEGGAGSKVESNDISGNQTGVKYAVAGGDLGGGATGSAGGNIIACNAQDDLVSSASTAITISAANNAWDHSSPTVGCNAGDDVCDTKSGTANAATIVATPATQAATHCPAGVTYYVNFLGDDANPGTQGSPFKTITKGLSVATSGSTVVVAPGTYDLLNLETFPITVPDGVLLIGDEANKGAGGSPTTIAGGAAAPGFANTSVTVLAGTGSTVAGFTITNTFATLPVRRGVILQHDNVSLKNNTVTGASHQYGIYVDGTSANDLIAGNRIVNNGPGTGTGLGFISGGANSKVENNVITGNGTGIEYDVDGGDLGGGPAGSAGGNTISCNGTTINGGVDIVLLPSAPITLSAKNNFWDHVAPTQSCNFTGDDICDGNAGTALASIIVTDGAALAASPCP
ncbi:MAG TPA: DUF1565 domain-containing protein [Burkholderiales bacterium]|nr:DUF1565 domain-containing protein [Burkholderiales bacterium]